MEKWKKLLSKAIDCKNKSENLLEEAVQELMRTKGFSDEQIALFDASFATGNETVVSFNDDGENGDFGIESYCFMTKEEIIVYLSKFCKTETIELLTKKNK